MGLTPVACAPSLPVIRRSGASGAAPEETAAPVPGTNLRSGDKYGEHHPSVLGAPPTPTLHARRPLRKQAGSPPPQPLEPAETALPPPAFSRASACPRSPSCPLTRTQRQCCALGLLVQTPPMDESLQKPPLPPKPQGFAPAAYKHPFRRHFLCAQAQGGHAKMRKAWPHPWQFHGGLASPV